MEGKVGGLLALFWGRVLVRVDLSLAVLGLILQWNLWQEGWVVYCLKTWSRVQVTTIMFYRGRVKVSNESFQRLKRRNWRLARDY